MRVKLPLLRIRSVPATRAPILRYGVAVLSIILALIPALLLSDVVESRLVVFAVAIMVSAWYGGWKPGLVATSFALTVSAYFSLEGAQSYIDYRKAIIHLTLFVFVAVLICSFNAALRSAQEALRRSETNFRSLVTNAPYGICRCDSSGSLLSANPAFAQMLGYASPNELRSENLANLYADSHDWFALADYFRSLQPFTGVSAEWKRKDGRSIVVRISGRAIRNKNREIFFEFFTEDVTVRRALELQLRQAQKMEAIGRLAGGIAHDFNNLLMVISGYCEFLLAAGGQDSAVRGPAKEIANAANRATSLTRQLLAFSRKQMLMPKVIDLNAVLTENLRMLTRMIGEDIDLVMIPAADLGAVKADPGQIEQVMMNLAVNARDAMPHGGKLTIETANVLLDEDFTRLHAPVPPGEYVRLSIRDSGMGMDAETQTHIFEPFFSTKGTKGTGLGLSTVYGIIKQSGGYISVESEPGKGAIFHIYLPRVSASGETTAEQPALVVNNEKNFETILLVEDEPNLRQLTQHYLNDQGFKVLQAADAHAALRIFNTHEGTIHMLLTDVIMPGMNGRELAQRIRALRPEIKVLYVSGYTENVIGHNGMLEAGVNLLQKPFTLPALKAKVREVLDTPLPLEVFMARTAQAQVRSIRQKVSPFRAQRFNLHLPLKYRLMGETDWRIGTTENISRSGLLFRGDEMIPLSAQLEINLVLPAEIAGLTAAEVVCKGEVVRSLGPGASASGPAMAARILQYHFQHSGPVADA
jgi:PAS domain S-box-containing protein